MTRPAWAAVNATPSSTDPGSAAWTVPGTAPSEKNPQGQRPTTSSAAAVRKVPWYGGDIALPPRSVAEALTVCTVSRGSGVEGTKRAVRLGASKVTTPGTWDPSGRRSSSVTDAGVTASENVTRTSVPGATLVAPSAGCAEATLGGRSVGTKLTSTQ